VTPAGKHLPQLSALVLWVAAIGSGVYLSSASPAGSNGQSGGAAYLLGPARALLSASLYERADLYFHKGAPRHKEEAFQSIFQKWQKLINPDEHRHTDAAETLEIMPWLRLATQSDPHNIEAFMVAAYWLNGECGEPELALDVIREAAAHNPGRYEVYLEKGRILLSIDKPTAAMDAFESALTLVRNKEQSDPEQAAIDHSLLLTIQSYLHEAQGDRDGALRSAQRYIQLHPDRAQAAERLARLQSDPLDPAAAETRLKELFVSSYVCAEETASACGCAHCAEADDGHVHDESCSHEHEEHVHDENCGHEHEEHVHGPQCRH
jgi:tetratricopeptide (TPR) repeat protein